MLGSYRGIVVALAGLALLAGQHPYAEAKEQQTAPQERSASALEHIATAYDQQAKGAERSNYERKCNPGDDQRDSDLCAQWKAADAAADSAWWAAFAGWFGGLSFLGVLAAIGLAYHSNWIARDAAKRQLRAYISVDPKGVFALDETDGHVRVPILITNHGETPANKVAIDSWFRVEEDPRSFDPTQEDYAVDEELRMGSEQVYFPGPGRHVYVRLPSHPTRETWDQIAKGALALLHFGIVTYEDVFGERRETRFAFYHRGEELNDSEAKFCPFGNTAT